jgi:hypothetical protein
VSNQKVQKQWVGLAVAIVFSNLVILSCMPLSAAKTQNKAEILPPAISPLTDGPIKLSLLTEGMPLKQDDGVSIAYENGSNPPTQRLALFASLLGKTIDDKLPQGSLSANNGNVILAAGTRSDLGDKTVEIRYQVKAVELPSPSGRIEVDWKALSQLVVVFCYMQGIEFTGTAEIKMAMFSVGGNEVSPYTQISNVITISADLSPQPVK